MEMHNECQRERQRENQNLNEHSCQYCPIKKRKLDAIPQLNFRPTTLRQQILLQLGYTTYGKTGDQSVDNLPLPEALIAEVKRVHDELQRWRQDNKRFDETARDSIIYRCFLSDLHWIPGKTVIDRRTTARMILQCDVGFYRPNEFLLAAANCLEDEVARLWPLLDQRTREHWNSADNPYVKNPIFMYWIAKCANRPERMTCALDRMASYCIDKGEQNFDTLTYFWPSIVESKGGIGSDDMAILLDHSFHEAIEQSNREAAYFIWRQAPVENYRSMVSAAHCCGARNAYYAFGKAVEAGQYDVVQFMWNKTDAEQHNGMLLAEHAKSFCLAAEQGFVDIARLLWRDTTYNQRFVLLFEQSCAAFRRSCANGHVEIVRLLWEVSACVSSLWGSRMPPASWENTVKIWLPFFSGRLGRTTPSDLDHVPIRGVGSSLQERSPERGPLSVGESGRSTQIVSRGQSMGFRNIEQMHRRIGLSRRY